MAVQGETRQLEVMKDWTAQDGFSVSVLWTWCGHVWAVCMGVTPSQSRMHRRSAGRRGSGYACRRLLPRHKVGCIVVIYVVIYIYALSLEGEGDMQFFRQASAQHGIGPSRAVRG